MMNKRNTITDLNNMKCKTWFNLWKKKKRNNFDDDKPRSYCVRDKIHGMHNTKGNY